MRRFLTRGWGLTPLTPSNSGSQLKKKYGITLTADDKDNKRYFASLAALADFVRTNRA